MNDDDLEQAVRGALERRAERTTVDGAVLDRARRSARRRSATRSTLAALAGAAAVAAVAATVGIVDVGSRDQDGIADDVSGPEATDRTTPSDRPLRTEYWAGVQVDVPDDWAWGSTPSPEVCGAPPVGRPYVGRPIGYTDACGVVDPDATPTAPYVWLGAGIDPGVVDLGGGYTRETVEVAGTDVSVATTDPGLRARIVESAAPGGLCAASLDTDPRPLLESTFEGVGPFVAAHLCAYRRASDDDPRLTLVYGERLDERVVERTFGAVASTEDADRRCTRSDEIVVVEATYADPYSRDVDLRLDRRAVYDLSCGTVRRASAASSDVATGLLTEATVPWAGPQFRRLLVGAGIEGSWAYRRFIGVQG